MAHRQGRRGFGIRSRLLALVAVPIIALLAVTALDVSRAVRLTRDSAEITGLLRHGDQVAALITDVQQERAWSVRYLVTAGAQGQQELAEARHRTDLRLAALGEEVVGSGEAAGSSEALTMPGLAAQRRAVSALEPRDAEARGWYDEHYTELLGALVDTATSVQRRTGDAEVRDRATNLVTLAALKELAFSERALLEPAVAGRALTGSQRVALEANAAAQDSQFALWTSTAPAGAVQRYGAVLQGEDGVSTNLLGDLRPGLSGFGSGAAAPASAGYDEAMQTRIDRMVAAERSLHAEALGAAERLEEEAANELLLLVALAAVVLLGGVLLALVTTRSLVRPMRQLDAAARRLRERLPAAVEAIQDSGAALEADDEVTPLERGAPPELAQLSEALGEVGAVAVEVAAGQARLRASISEMFTNFARRNQRLLDRQLSLIDALEADEGDPDRLAELFDLDHLSTRMRRNAESLLVLAGTDPTPSGHGPLDLVDVVRVAVSEIEDYERVDIAVDEPVRIAGRAVSSLAHLLAELLENATAFSPPDTPVRIDAFRASDGELAVIVTDGGIGMSPDELAAANDRIAHPPLIDAAASRLLGFFVVGRLARKLGVGVRLEPASPRGLRAVVSVPPALLAEEAGIPTEEAAVPPADPSPRHRAQGGGAAPVVASQPAMPVKAAAELDDIHRRTEGPSFSQTPPTSTAGLARRTRRTPPPAPDRTSSAAPSTPLSPDSVAATLASLMGGWRKAETEDEQPRSAAPSPERPAAPLPAPGSTAGRTPAYPAPTGDQDDPTAARLPRRSREPRGPGGDGDAAPVAEAPLGTAPGVPVAVQNDTVAPPTAAEAIVETTVMRDERGPARTGSLWSKARRTPRPPATSWSTPWPTEEDGR